mmetsp:Transcript_5599/g.8466  ORF Transcript_5599/g.8466 Transcript_5599/m.8466 type:complete len:89 (-) Transcript_5599:106-372(-)
MYQVYVKTLTQECYLIDTDPTATIGSVKEQIQQMEGIPVDQQRLIFAGKVLQDHRTMAAYCIQTESCLHLILKKEAEGEKKRREKKKG